MLRYCYFCEEFILDIMKKILLLIVVALCYVSNVSAQNYNWALGARIGGEMSGLDVKYNLNASHSIEALLAIPYSNGFVLTGLYEWNIQVIDNGFRFYYGVGAHVGGWKSRCALGVDGVIGLEYQFSEIPLNLALDYKPIFNIVEKTRFYLADIGLSIRIAF